MDVKIVRRIASQCGRGLLALQTHESQQWRANRLAAGTELAGKQVCVQIDGGRTKIRGALRLASRRKEHTDEDGLLIDNAPGRSRKRPGKAYDAQWREPKLVTMFVHDETSRMVKGSQPTIDGTFLGPDAMAELMAMHLHRLGAAQAAKVTFVADGAPWIWDRIPTINRLAKLEHVPVNEVLDCCHAAHHIGDLCASAVQTSSA